MDAAVFGRLGLLIAVSFSGAATRFDVRRQLIVEEANNIGTAWLRLDLLPASAQPALRDLFRKYVDARLSVFRQARDYEAARKELDRSVEMQGEIWRKAVAACDFPEGQGATLLLLPALNAMFDITTTRTMATQTHPPTVVFLLLGGLALSSALLAGVGMAGGQQRSWIHTLAFSVIMGLCVYVILDLEHPRLGLIRVDAADQLLEDVRKSMNP